jgi:hypothetical protein
LTESTPQASTRATESTLHASARATESTFQTSARTYFVDRKDKMTYEVEYTDEFEQWYVTLDAKTQARIDGLVKLLEQIGPNLGSPFSSDIKGSRHPHIRELRIQHKGEPYRILYAFDPRRVAILLLGGNKKGNDRWYEENVPKADKLYDELLQELDDEGLI